MFLGLEYIDEPNSDMPYTLNEDLYDMNSTAFYNHQSDPYVPPVKSTACNIL